MDMRLNAIAFEKYYHLLKAGSPQLAGMIIYGAHDLPQWLNSDCQIDAATIKLMAQSQSGAEAGAINLTGKYQSFCYPLDATNDAATARLVLVLHAADLQQCDDGTHPSARSFATIAQLISHEYQLHDEIDSLASELVERYEELNLIYHTDDQISDFSTGKLAIKNIVEQCIQHLDIDMALLVVPNREIFVVARSSDCSIADDSEYIQTLQQKLLDHMQVEPRQFVVNSAQEAARLQLNIGGEYKLVCSPVAAEDNRACGVIALLKGAEKSDFTNSQRNLLGVLEHKVAKIIQQSYDKLTSLLNWASFQHILEAELGACSVQEENCLLMLDVNQLHVVNDMGGFDAGDALLIDIADTFSQQLADCGIVARQSGDVFVALLRQCDVTQAEILACELQRSINDKGFSWQAEAFRINVNIGITPVQPGTNAKTVISAAEHALAVAGEKGINRIEVNRVSNTETSVRKNRIAWVNRVHDALRNDRFELHCQAIYPTANQAEPHHYELLIRMRDENGELVAPYNFIPAAEYYQIMPEVDRWVIRKTLQTLHEEWETLRHFPYSWAINLSGQTFSQPDFKAFIVGELRNSTVPASRLGFEVTETATVEKLADAQQLLTTIKSFGCDVYLDDFGTGLSSFSYLKSLPFDFLKIDGSFIKQITEDPVSEAMVVAIKDMAQVTGLKTIAEFVENQKIITCLERIGIEYLQGYGLHAPETMHNIIAGLKSRRAGLAA